MRWTPILTLTLTAALTGTALADMGGAPKSDPTPTPTTPSTEASTTTIETPRQQAERSYSDAYDEVAKAKKDAANKKDKNAEKHFKKALEKAQQAVQTDSTYYEAWNLVGYSSRNLKNYDGAVAAYSKALAIKPDYAPAREYLGEAYLEMGQIAKAREQLAMLVKLDATAEQSDLKTAIAAYEAAHPEAPAADTPAAAPQAANPDSAGTTKP